MNASTSATMPRVTPAAPTSEAALIAAVRRDPARPAAWSQLGRWYLDHGAPEAARLCAARSQALDPTDRDALLVEAATTGPDAGNTASVRDLYARALAAGADHPSVHVNLALTHLATGDDATAALHLRDALLAQPRDVQARRALRIGLARVSTLYRVLAAPRFAVDWLRRHLATTRFGFLPVIEIGSLLITFLGVLHNPFNPHKAAAIFLVTWFMAVWWPLVATLESLAALRLRAGAGRRVSPAAARDALAPRGGVVVPLLAAASTVSVALGWYVVEPMYGLFMMVFVEINSVFLVGGLLLTELVRHARSSARRQRVRELVRTGANG